MDFSIPEELRMLRDSTRRFVEQELLPLAACRTFDNSLQFA